MEKLAVGVLGCLITALVILLAALLGTALGALAGWIVGWTTFGGWILRVLSTLGMKGFTMAEFGALLGFAGGFLRASCKGS